MIYITGDTHGTLDIYKLITFFQIEEQKRTLTKDDYVIILGDVGVCWEGGEGDKEVKNILWSLPVTVLFIDGNHENFAMLNAYEEEEWKGGMVHRIAPDILHLMRGYVFEIDGKTFFTMGGGRSIDKMYRQEGISWWPEEMPSKEEYERGMEALEAHDFSVDYILTHTAPRELIPELGKDIWEGEEELQQYLQRVADWTEFEEWFFGHFHEDSDIDEYHCLMERVITL